jgi:hypothetical protein
MKISEPSNTNTHYTTYQIPKLGFEDVPFLLPPAFLIVLSVIDPVAHIGSMTISLFAAGILLALTLRAYTIIIHGKIGPFGNSLLFLTLCWFLFIVFATANGMMRGWEKADIARDILRFGAMGLVFWLVPGFWSKWSVNRAGEFWVKVLVLAGVCQAAHAWWIIAHMGGIGTFISVVSDILTGAEKPEISEMSRLGHIAHSPAVLFAGLYLLGIGVSNFFSHTVRGMGMIFLAMLIVSLWALTLTRSFLLLSFLMILFILWTEPGRALKTSIIVLFIIVVGIAFSDIIVNIFNLLLYKQKLRGFNARIEEWKEIFVAVLSTPWGIFFGLGNGATYPNPALGGARWESSHSVLSFVFLKGGIMGGMIFLGFATFLTITWWRGLTSVVGNHPERVVLVVVAVCALTGLIHATFKNLSYGFVLVLIPLLSVRYESRKLQKSQTDL